MIHKSTGTVVKSTSSTLPPSASLESIQTPRSGFRVTGKVVSTNPHTLKETVNGIQYHRFVAIVVEATSVARRTFDANGVEIDTTPVATEDVKRTGYLSTSYAKDKKRDPNEVGGDVFAAECLSLVPDDLRSSTHPAKKHHFMLLAPAESFKAVDFQLGAEVRLATRGLSPLIEMLSATSVAGAGTLYAGQDVKSSWADNVAGKGVAAKQVKSEDLPWEKNETAVADDEWDD